jgi:hypothetical protein
MQITREDLSYKVGEQHFQGGWRDRSILEVNHYNERGLDLNYFWQRILFKTTPSNEDMEVARLEACKTFLRLGGHVLISILDSLVIPENDRNSPLDMREGHQVTLGKDHYGFPVVAKKKTGNPGNQYYDWTPMNDVEKRLVQVRKLLYQEQKKGKR